MSYIFTTDLQLIVERVVTVSAVELRFVGRVQQLNDQIPGQQLCHKGMLKNRLHTVMLNNEREVLFSTKHDGFKKGTNHSNHTFVGSSSCSMIFQFVSFLCFSYFISCFILIHLFFFSVPGFFTRCLCLTSHLCNELPPKDLNLIVFLFIYTALSPFVLSQFVIYHA